MILLSYLAIYKIDRLEKNVKKQGVQVIPRSTLNHWEKEFHENDDRSEILIEDSHLYVYSGLYIYSHLYYYSVL